MKKRATASLSAREWLRGRATTPAPSKRATTGRPKAASSGYVSQKKLALLRPAQTLTPDSAVLVSKRTDALTVRVLTRLMSARTC